MALITQDNLVEMSIILLYAGQYEMPDEKTGVINRGVTCNYYFNTNLNAEDNKNGTKGTRPAKCSMDYDLMGKIVKAPAIYNALFKMKIGSDMKPVLTIVDLEFVTEVEIVPKVKDGQVVKDAPAGKAG